MQDKPAAPAAVVEQQVRVAVADQLDAATNVLDDKISLLVNKKIEGLTKELDKVRAIQAVQAQTNAKLCDNRPRPLRAAAVQAKESFETRYLECRRSVRLWPVDHTSEATLWEGVSQFFFDKLLISTSDLSQDSVECITRVLPGKRKKKIESEVIVRFTSVQVRDMVVSYAPNLRAWREQDGSGRSAAGLRLEIPDHLMSVFKTLERFGHQLKDKYKEGLRRHIRYDDYKMTLVIDFALPGEEKWQRVDFENAREEMRNHPPRSIEPRFSSSSAADVDGAQKPWGVPGQSRQDPAQAQTEGQKETEEEDMEEEA